jgi:mono/diheme cytochrome c family protein
LMNYPAYGRSDQEDIVSMIAYLRTLSAIPNDVPQTELDFPVSYIVNTIPARAALAPRPDSSNSEAYGKYVVTMASCIVCHSPVDKGKIVAGMEFAGGREFASSGGHILRSPNITPEKETGIGNWTREMFMRRFRQYADSGYTPRHTGRNEPNTPMPWLAFAGMHENDLSAIYSYLKTIKPIHHPVTR